MKYFREPVNALTHLIGAGLSLIGLLVLLYTNIHFGNSTPISLFSITVFGLSLIALYATSGIFHMAQTSDSHIKRLQKWDHAMIYVLIAGTYTPFCLLSLDGGWKYSLISVIWSFALVGILLSIFFIHMPRFYTTAIYIIMGWLAVIAIIPLYRSLSIGGTLFLFLGGVVYTVGGVIYGLKKPNLSTRWGFHELFHLFVIAGSLLHFYAILNYVIL